MPRVARGPESRGRVRSLSDDERRRLLDECRQSANRYLYPVVLLALSTGARRGELLSLTWPQADLSRALIVLHETKNSDRRVLPLAGPALAAVRELAKVRRLDTALVFPRENGQVPVDITGAFNSAVERAGMEDFRFHDLRHSCASYLAMSGASLAEIAEVLGHRTLLMVRRYAHLSEAHTAGVVARMNEWIFPGG